MNIIADNMPYDSIVSIVLKHDIYPYFGGTGFFVHFPPKNDVFLLQRVIVLFKKKKIII